MAVLTVTAVFARRAEVDDLNPVAIEGDWLQYHDGSPCWFCWEGTWRGTWFNIQDFIPGVSSGWIWQSCAWFYHYGGYPWDTSDFYFEIWNGNAVAPVVQVDRRISTASNYSPVYVDWVDCAVEQNFWCIVNTELSAGGWPSIVSDGNNPDSSAVVHSFLSDDFIVWEPLNMNGPCNYMTALIFKSYPPSLLQGTTWGSLKAVFTDY
ncbi:hypothetical protein CSA37_04730 [Candidatus Fermentibacteria bacterium]|nr:MAG: hypothetical protein CSA37_04730 [Candidatus Fermentibacteria bacterium]